MRLIFYIFLIYQIFTFLGVFAEKVKEDSSKVNPIKWEKIEQEKFNRPKKIFWESYKNDDNSFQKNHQKDAFKENKNLTEEKQLLKFGGLTVDNAIFPGMGASYLIIDYDSSGNIFSSYSYSYSNRFQLNLINAGSFKIKNNTISRNSQLTNIYLGHNNLNYRVGGKFLIFSSEKNDLIWLSSRFSLGRDLDSRQGYIYTDLTSTIKLNDWISININPKYIFSGVGNLGAIGLSNNIVLSNKFQFISETNLGITKDSSDNSSFSLRYSYSPANSIDLFATNSVGFQDIGSMLSTRNYKFGIRMNYIF